MNRRKFVKTSVTGAAGLAASAVTASSLGRVLGANDRLSIGVVGLSARARETLMPWFFDAAGDLNAEITAVCDLWTVNLAKGVEQVKKTQGRAPREYRHMSELLAESDIDGVILATGDHQHAPLLPSIIDAGKDCYCEKPMAIKLNHAKAAYRAVKGSKQVVQVGTQGVSDPNTHAAAAVIRSGVLGKVSKVDIMANYWGPRWTGRPEVKQIKESDTDWREWLIDRPYRPFDPRLYFEYRLYRDFAAGIAGQWMCHNTAAVQTIMGTTFPKSVVARGGNYLWKDGREIWDTFHALVDYPGDFVFSYCCHHGTDYPWYHRYYGLNGTVEAVTGEFFPAYRITGVGGGNLPTPENLERERREAYSGTGYRVNRDRVREDKVLDTAGVGGTPGANGHMRNWLECIRSRKTPNADIESGYAHSVTTMMCQESEISGKVVYWDPDKEEILTEPPDA